MAGRGSGLEYVFQNILHYVPISEWLQDMCEWVPEDWSAALASVYGGFAGIFRTALVAAPWQCSLSVICTLCPSALNPKRLRHTLRHRSWDLHNRSVA